MIKVKKTGPWGKVGDALASSQRDVPAVLAMSQKAEAEYAVKMMKLAITSQGESNGVPWPRLSSWTSFSKGGSRALRQTTLLEKSIKARRVGGKWLAGPDRRASYTNGMSVEDVARVHEEGARYWVELTHRMAALLAIRAKELGISPKKGGTLPVGSKLLIVIPRRSFIEDTRKKHFGTLAVTKRFAMRVAQGLPVVRFFQRYRE